jgi:hypothetical protein
MTQDDIISMYEKANGWSPAGWDNAEYWTAYEQDVAAAERESCAKMLAEEGWLMAATLVRVKK